MKIQKRILIILLIKTIFSCPNSDERCIRCGGDTCIECIDSFINNSGLCIAPAIKKENCLSYLNLDNCKKCKFGFKLENGNCYKIEIENCVKKNENGSCLICGKGYKNEKGDCIKKNCEIYNCGLCRNFGENEICELCHKNFVLYNFQNEEGIIENKCLHENGRTMNCEISRFNDFRQCLKCNINYYYHSGKCVRSNEYFFEDVFFVESVLNFAFSSLICFFSVFYL